MNAKSMNSVLAIVAVIAFGICAIVNVVMEILTFAPYGLEILFASPVSLVSLMANLLMMAGCIAVLVGMLSKKGVIAGIGCILLVIALAVLLISSSMVMGSIGRMLDFPVAMRFVFRIVGAALLVYVLLSNPANPVRYVAVGAFCVACLFGIICSLQSFSSIAVLSLIFEIAFTVGGCCAAFWRADVPETKSGVRASRSSAPTAEDLEQYAGLLKEGVISQEDFDRKKAEFLKSAID